jgi:Leucine-rich repeat (LRR) protein
MDGAALTDGGLECLKDCTNLTILSLMNCRIAGTGFREFRRPNAMRQLHLSCNKLSATGVDALVKAFPGVESLSIDGAHMTDDDMAPIWKLKDVKFFGASDNPVTDRTLERMADWASVCEIGLIRTKVTGSGLSKLKKCANLRGLWLSGSPVTDKGIASLPPLQGLSSLCLSKTLVSDDALAAVAKLPNLRNVYLKNSKIVGHGMAAFKGHPKLELIDLNDSNFSGDHLHLLLDIPALRVIAIGGSRCNREQVENFGKLRPVMKIYCSNL